MRYVNYITLFFNIEYKIKKVLFLFEFFVKKSNENESLTYWLNTQISVTLMKVA